MTIDDNQILMGYLEDERHFGQLYGSGQKTAVGAKKVTKNRNGLMLPSTYRVCPRH